MAWEGTNDIVQNQAENYTLNLKIASSYLYEHWEIVSLKRILRA